MLTQYPPLIKFNVDRINDAGFVYASLLFDLNTDYFNIDTLPEYTIGHNDLKKALGEHIWISGEDVELQGKEFTNFINPKMISSEGNIYVKIDQTIWVKIDGKELNEVELDSREIRRLTNLANLVVAQKVADVFQTYPQQIPSSFQEKMVVEKMEPFGEGQFEGLERIKSLRSEFKENFSNIIRHVSKYFEKVNKFKRETRSKYEEFMTFLEDYNRRLSNVEESMKEGVPRVRVKEFEGTKKGDVTTEMFAKFREEIEKKFEEQALMNNRIGTKLTTYVSSLISGKMYFPITTLKEEIKKLILDGTIDIGELLWSGMNGKILAEFLNKLSEDLIKDNYSLLARYFIGYINPEAPDAGKDTIDSDRIDNYLFGFATTLLNINVIDEDEVNYKKSLTNILDASRSITVLERNIASVCSILERPKVGLDGKLVYTLDYSPLSKGKLMNELNKKSPSKNNLRIKYINAEERKPEDIIKFFKKRTELVNKYAIGVIPRDNAFRKYLAEHLGNKIKSAKEKTARKEHSIMIFGRTASGKTYFWEEFVKYFFSEEGLFTKGLNRRSDNGFKVENIRTTGFYPHGEEGGFVIRQNFIHKEDSGFVKIKTEKAEQYADKFGTMEEVITKKPKKKKNPKVFERIEGRGEGVYDMPEIEVDFSVLENIKDVLEDNRLEFIRAIKYKNETSIHYSTRNHINKTIKFSNGFVLNFFIWAGDEDVIGKYYDGENKENLKTESSYFNKTNDAFMTFLGLTEKSNDNINKSSKNLAMKNNAFSWVNSWTKGNLSVIFAVYPGAQSELIEGGQRRRELAKYLTGNDEEPYKEFLKQNNKILGIEEQIEDEDLRSVVEHKIISQYQYLHDTQKKALMSEGIIHYARNQKDTDTHEKAFDIFSLINSCIQ
jgi:hypothetical protein